MVELVVKGQRPVQCCTCDALDGVVEVASVPLGEVLVWFIACVRAKQLFSLPELSLCGESTLVKEDGGVASATEAFELA